MPSFAEVSARRRWQQSPVTGKSTKETVKTIARGKPGRSGEPVVTTLVCSNHFARETAGAAGTRLSLLPPFSRDDVHSSGACLPREGGRLSCFSLQDSLLAGNLPGDGRDQHCVASQARHTAAAVGEIASDTRRRADQWRALANWRAVSGLRFPAFPEQNSGSAAFYRTKA
jgi:hypothetical protein